MESMDDLKGQMSLFDFIPKNSSLTREKCLHKADSPCNILNAHDVARRMDIDCQYGCCAVCRYMEECGARCNNCRISNEKPQFTRKTCAATLKECDCHCGTDSITDKCCSSCIISCEHRCEHSMNWYEVFDKPNKTWIRNPDYFNPVWDLIAHGTGFVNGMDRVRNYFTEKHTGQEKAQFLKKEYGIGGFGIPHEGRKNFVHGSMSDAKGIKIEYLDAIGENHEELITWEKLEKEISFLVGKEWY